MNNYDVNIMPSAYGHKHSPVRVDEWVDIDGLLICVRHPVMWLRADWKWRIYEAETYRHERYTVPWEAFVLNGRAIDLWNRRNQHFLDVCDLIDVPSYVMRLESFVSDQAGTCAKIAKAFRLTPLDTKFHEEKHRVMNDSSLNGKFKPDETVWFSSVARLYTDEMIRRVIELVDPTTLRRCGYKKFTAAEVLSAGA